MSTEQTELLEGIKGKIESVKVMLQEQRGLNRELSIRNDALQKEVQQKQSMINELEERNQKLALVKGILAESGNSDEARVKINRIVREIDKCIALLNRT
jgi:flagellar biosynthesis/type III secretory pathway chaperone